MGVLWFYMCFGRDSMIVYRPEKFAGDDYTKISITLIEC